jgi:catechol 2,3-dioxygenase-like lactoylglutathione lyase family enzyme
MQIQFISSFAIIAPDPATSRSLYLDALGLKLDPAGPGADYVFTEQLQGSKHFGVWPLSEAAQACFGSPVWPSDRPVPQASIEFDVPDSSSVETAAQELAQKGYELLHGARTEPWGQIVARMQTPEGVILGISYVPSMHADSRGG